MKESFKDLLEKFNNIESQGFIEMPTNARNISGVYFEKLLGCGSDFCYPDYNGIELKVLRNNPNATFELFSMVPDSKHIFTTQWLSEKFGYPDRDYRNIKILQGDVFGNRCHRIGLFYKYKLKIDYKKEKIVLYIYNCNWKIVNSEVYWSFKDVKERLELKLRNLAIITTDKVFKGNKTYVHYKDIKMYTLKSFETFLSLIEVGKIYVSFATGVYKSGPHIGKFIDHGTTFKISKADIEDLFIRVY